MESSDENSVDKLPKIHEELSSELLYTHSRINIKVSKTLKSSSFLYALIELLIKQGLLTLEKLDKRKRQVAERLVKRFVESGLGFMYQDPEYDKYTFDKDIRLSLNYLFFEKPGSSSASSLLKTPLITATSATGTLLSRASFASSAAFKYPIFGVRNVTIIGLSSR